ncbi:FAD-binding domain-containing protein [Limnobacter parvus]|uniref:Deoxyribodipyrimidine photolyase n=1 Tax=Limnobacter parvus TaxID=2939690 RepID=A0ABT1XCL1_9BURK|nr:FAD-binding domain-containing protein [Limnobacter parvus]MCR2745030.1 deoxyribodipyrimidine photolyase [Limnobacter parvus]
MPKPDKRQMMQYETTIKYEPNRQAALDVLAAIDPLQYSRSRNFLDGAVTGLSPWITHGYINVREATQVLMKKHRLSFEDKLIFEFAWREFFKHAHGELGIGILSDVRRPVWSGRYNHQLPDDIQEGRTGVEAIDAGVALLYKTGYLHNHVRMWIASYVVHMRKVHWKVGADWMYAHLLDGDLASNHLSWQWVAGTFSHKPYVFNADNVKKFAPKWDCRGTVIDSDYEDLESIARAKRDTGRERNAPSVGVAEPSTYGFDLESLGESSRRKIVDLRDTAGVDSSCLLVKQFREIELVHPWDLKTCFQPTTQGLLRLGVIDCAFHKAHKWSELRWNFVMAALEKGCEQIWIVNTDHLAHNAAILAKFKQCNVQLSMRTTLNPGYSAMWRCFPLQWTPEEKLLPNPARFQQSFSRFYKEATQIAGSLEEAVHDEALVHQLPL